MSWGNASQFQNSMQGGTQLLTLCMHRHFGVTGCPHCAAAADIFARARNGQYPGGQQVGEEEGRKVYVKKLYFGYGIVTMPGKPHNNQLCLINWPSKQVEKIISSCMAPEADVRWPAPDDILTGRAIVLRKFKKDATFSDYDVQLANEPAPLTEEWWTQAKANLPALLEANASQIFNMLTSWPTQNVFWPKKAMQNDDRARIRMLPNPAAGQTPFILLHVHYVQALSAWDKEWAAVGYDPKRIGEVPSANVAMTGGMGGSMPSFPQPGAVSGGMGGRPSFPQTAAGIDKM